jgi:O-antigen ligase
VGYVIISVTDLAILLGMVVLLTQTKVVRRVRLQPVPLRMPLYWWLVVGLLGLLVAIAQGVPWANYVAELKGWYFWILIVVLCVNVVRTRLTLWLIMLTAVVSAMPNVLTAVREAASGQNVVATQLASGTVVNRTAGGSGLINQFAFYIMAMFFIALGMALASRRWPARLFFFSCAAYFLVGIALTYTRGAWIATVVGLLVLGVAGGRRVLAGVLALATVGYFLIPAPLWDRLNFSDGSVTERVVFLDTAMAAIHANPIFGGGWGSNYYLAGKSLEATFDVGNLPLWHNDYLVVATQVGLPGLAVFLWIWVALFIVAIRAYWRASPGPLRTYLIGLLAAMAAMLTQAFTDNFSWHNETGPLMWLVVGLICAAANLVEEERAATPPTVAVAFRQPWFARRQAAKESLDA